MDLRSYLQVVRRHRWLIQSLFVAGLLLGLAASVVRAPVYQANVSVLLLPNDPAERVTEQPTGSFDPEQYAKDQVTVVTGQEVAQEAAGRLKVSQSDLLEMVTVAVGDSNGLLNIAARASEPQRASQIANVMAESFIEVRRRDEVDALKRGAAQIDVQLAALRQQIAALRSDSSVTVLDATVQAASNQYSSLFARQQDMLVDSSLKQGEAKIVARATPPLAASGVSTRSSAVLGALLGLMIGFGVAFLREQLDDRLRSRDEVEELTGYAVLAELPSDRGVTRDARRLPMQDDPRGSFAEATRTLRTSISFLGFEEPIRRLLVTSATTGEGKTVVAANLAVAFAQTGMRTLVVSADLRHPRLETLLGFEELREGLSTILGAAGGSLGSASHRDADQEAAALRAAVHHALQPTAVRNLTLLPAGLLPPNPAELLASSRMDQVLEELGTMFDVVVLDTTPMMPVTDTAALASKVGQVLLVTARGTSRAQSVERLIEVTRLTDATVLGVVLNKAEAERSIGSGGGERWQRPKRHVGVPEPVGQHLAGAGSLRRRQPADAEVDTAGAARSL